MDRLYVRHRGQRLFFCELLRCKVICHWPFSTDTMEKGSDLSKAIFLESIGQFFSLVYEKDPIQQYGSVPTDAPKVTKNHNGPESTLSQRTVWTEVIILFYPFAYFFIRILQRQEPVH